MSEAMVRHRVRSGGPNTPPAFSISHPAAWSAAPLDDALVMLAEAPEEGRFRANVVVSADTVGPDADLESAAAVTLAQTREAYTDFTLVQEKIGEIDGETTHIRVQSFQPSEMRHSVFQLQLLLLAPASGDALTRFLIHVLATCLAADAEEYAPQFADIGLSLQFERTP